VNSSSGSGFVAALPLLLTLILGAVPSTPASAQVLEIGADGAVVTYAGPGRYTDDGVEAITISQTAAPASVSRLDVTAAIRSAAAHHQVSASLIEAVAWQESRMRQTARSPKGAIGIMQLMPGTARALRVDAHDLEQNVWGGAAYLSQMLHRYGGNLRLALAAYNAGPAAVDRYRGVPPYAETQAYVSSILDRLAARAQ